MNFFPSRSRCCDRCCQRTLKVKDREGKEQEVVEYYHRGVVCSLVGSAMAMPLDVEMIQPGEDEVGAGRRLLERVFQGYPRYFDTVVGDAAFFEAPFMKFCVNHGKHVITVMKDERRQLSQDAGGVFRITDPVTWRQEGKHVQAWDQEGFSSCEGLDKPLRVLQAIETERVRVRRGRRTKIETKIHTWRWTTTIPCSLMPTKDLWEAGHHRWDIENKTFNDLVNHWGMDHCYKHDPTAIVNFVLTLFITFALLQYFHLRNLKRQVRARLTLIGLAVELLQGLCTLRVCAPWLLNLPVPDT